MKGKMSPHRTNRNCGDETIVSLQVSHPDYSEVHNK